MMLHFYSRKHKRNIIKEVVIALRNVELGQ